MCCVSLRWNVGWESLSLSLLFNFTNKLKSSQHDEATVLLKVNNLEKTSHWSTKYKSLFEPQDWRSSPLLCNILPRNMVELQTPGRTWSRKLFQSLECKIIPSLQTLSNSMLQSSWLSGWRSNSLVLSILGLQYSRELVLYLSMLIINKLIDIKLHFTKL